MKIRSKLIAILIIVIPICILTLKNVIALSQIDAGQYIAELAINFYNENSSKVLYSSTPDQKLNSYLGIRTKSGVTSNGKIINDNYTMDSTSWISLVYHNALGIGSNETLTYFAVASGDGNATRISDELEIVLGNLDSTEKLENREIDRILQPGDILFSEPSDGKLLLYVGSGNVIYCTSNGLVYEDVRDYSAGIVAVARITADTASNVTNPTTIYNGEGSLTGSSLNGGLTQEVIINEDLINNPVEDTGEEGSQDESDENEESEESEVYEDDNNARIVNENDKLPLYKHILLTEKYNFNNITWKSYGHSYDASQVPMKEDTTLGLRYPSDNKNTDLSTFVNLTQPFLQSWYIPLGISSGSIYSRKNTSDSNSKSRDVYFPYSVLKYAYSDILVNRYDLEKYTLQTKYDLYNASVYHNEVEVRVTLTSTYRETGGDQILVSSGTSIQPTSEISEVLDSTTPVDTRKDEKGNIQAMNEEYVSENKIINPSYCLISADTFDLKFYNEYDYQRYSDADAKNRVNPKSQRTYKTEPIDTYINAQNKIEELSSTGLTFNQFLEKYNFEIVTQGETQNTSIDRDGLTTSRTTTTYKLKSNNTYTHNVGNSYYVERVWEDNLSEVNKTISYYTLDDLINFNTTVRGGVDMATSTDIDIRAKGGNLPHITDRNKLIDIYAKSIGIENVTDYSETSLADLEQNRANIIASGRQITAEAKLINFRHIAQAIIDAQEKYNINALLIMAALEIESNTGADLNPESVVGQGSPWCWLSVDKGCSMYLDYKDDTSMSEGYAGTYSLRNMEWIKYTDPIYCVYDFAHLGEHAYLDTNRYNLSVYRGFCDDAWVTDVGNRIKKYCDLNGTPFTGEEIDSATSDNDVAEFDKEEFENSGNDYKTYKRYASDKILNRIDFINANPSIYNKYLNEGAEYSKFIGIPRAALDYTYSELKDLINETRDKNGMIPFVYFATLGFKTSDPTTNSGIITSDTSSGSGFGWPVELDGNDGSRVINCIFPPTQAYGGGHNAIDIAEGEGENNIIAAKAGTVIYVSSGYGPGYLGCTDGGGYGNSVLIDHGDGYYTRYSHLSSINSNIVVGKTVKKGERLGVMGTSGNSSGVHLDFTIYSGGYNARDRIDPLEFYNTEPEYGSIDPNTITSIPSGYVFKSEKSSSGDFNIFGTVLTKEEFVSSLNSFMEMRSDTIRQNYDRYFRNEIEEFYDICVNKGVNPEYAFVTAYLETSLGGGGVYNFWAYDVPNSDSILEHPKESMLGSLEEFCNSILTSATPGTAAYDRIVQRSAQREANGCDPGGYGPPTTMEGIQSTYSWLGKHVTGSAGEGGYYYIDQIGIIYQTQEEIDECHRNHPVGSDTTIQEQTLYTKWQCSKKKSQAKLIWGDRAGTYK